jgi:MscS family membrane protein
MSFLELSLDNFINYNTLLSIIKITIIFSLFFAFKRLITKYIISFLNTYILKTSSKFKQKYLDSTTSAIFFALFLICVYLSLNILNTSNTLIFKILDASSIGTLIYILICFVDLFSSYIEMLCSKIFINLYKEISKLAIKIIKIIIIFMGFISILGNWGIDVSAILASLGIGGLALALAAKDTVANFFGGLTLLTDDSLKVGDWVKIGDCEGIVEDIGLRATKIRTFSKSLINLPNQTLSNEAVENYSRRGIRRISFKIGLVYSTSEEQMNNILKDIKHMINTHKSISQDSIKLINFDEFSDSALLIRIYVFANTANWADYLNICEDVNLNIMTIVQKNRSSFAFPSTSLYIEQDKKI